MIDIDNPEFDLPFKLQPDGVEEIEQGSPTEIQNSVYAICCFRPGDRIDMPEFGIPDQLFRKGGADLDGILASIEFWDDRATEIAETDPAWYQSLVQTVSIRRDNNA